MSAPTTLVGRLAADPELKFTAGGRAMCHFAVITSRRTKDSDGNWTDTDNTYWRCTAWADLAENICELLAKGNAVIVHGTLAERSWTGKDGEEHKSIEMRADAVGPNLRWLPKDKQADRSNSAEPTW